MADLLNNDPDQHTLPGGSNPQVEVHTASVLQRDLANIGPNGTPVYALAPMVLDKDPADAAVAEQPSLRATGAHSPTRKVAHAVGEITHLYADGAGTDHTIAPQPTVATRDRVRAPEVPTVNNRPGYT